MKTTASSKTHKKDNSSVKQTVARGALQNKAPKAKTSARSSTEAPMIDASLITLAVFAGALLVGGYIYLNATDTSNETDLDFDGEFAEDDADLEMRSVDNDYDLEDEEDEGEDAQDLDIESHDLSEGDQMNSSSSRKDYK